MSSSFHVKLCWYVVTLNLGGKTAISALSSRPNCCPIAAAAVTTTWLHQQPTRKKETNQLSHAEKSIGNHFFV